MSQLTINPPPPGYSPPRKTRLQIVSPSKPLPTEPTVGQTTIETRSPNSTTPQAVIHAPMGTIPTINEVDHLRDALSSLNMVSSDAQHIHDVQTSPTPVQEPPIGDLLLAQKRAQKLLEIKAEGEKKGWTLHTKIYLGRLSKVEFTCEVPEHGSFSMLSHEIKTKSCGLCSKEQKQAQRLLELKAEGEKRKWILLTTKYQGGSRSRLEFTCGVSGHKSFTVRADVIKTRLGCTICNRPPRKLSPTSCKKRFFDMVEKKEGTIIGGTYSNEDSELVIACINRHEFKTRPSQIRIDHWCIYCHLDKLKLESAKEFHKEVIRRGGTCTDAYIDSTTKLLIVCHSKHEFWMRPGNVKQKQFCPKCAGKCPKQAKEKFETEVKKKGGTCIGEYVDNDTLTEIRCKDGHEFMMRPHCVKTGKWCAACVGLSPWLAAQKFYAIIEERGGTRIDDYINASTKVRVLCAQKHTFEAIPASTIHDGNWCPVCPRQTFLMAAQKFYTIIEERGGTRIDDYAGGTTKVRVLCAQNHIFVATPAHTIHIGAWCPVCRESKGANQVRTILRALDLPYVSECYTPETGKYRYDFVVYYKGTYVFIEYDGEQHFGESYYYTGDAFLRARNRDIFKTKKVIQRYQCKLIRIDHKSREDGLNLRQFIEQALASPALFIVSNLEMYDWLENGLRADQPLELPPEDLPNPEDDEDLEPTTSPTSSPDLQ